MTALLNVGNALFQIIATAQLLASPPEGRGSWLEAICLGKACTWCAGIEDRDGDGVALLCPYSSRFCPFIDLSIESIDSIEMFNEEKWLGPDQLATTTVLNQTKISESRWETTQQTE